MEHIESHSALIDLLGGAHKVAAEIDQKEVTVRAWKMRDRIPPEQWPAIIALAEQLGHVVTADWLMQAMRPRATPTQAAA